jgi:inner membrane protein
MDPVSQITLGAAVGGVFASRLGKKAVAIGALCGAFPDIDVVAGWAGEWATLIHHRGFTHSLLTLTLAAPAFGWLGYRWASKTDYFTWVHLAFWALVTHTLLDWCTAYGTQLAWPLSNRRFALDAVAVIDPAYTLPLLIALLLAAIPKVSRETTRRAAIAALLVSTAYLVVGYGQNRRALALAAPQLADSEFHPVETRALPSLFNVWLWRIVARDEDGNLAVGMLSTWSPGRIHFIHLERPDHPLVDEALASEHGQVFHWFAMDMVAAEVEPHARGTSVILSDQRYGLITRPTESPFRARAQFDAEGNLLAMDVLPRQGDIDVRAELALLWRLIRGD